MKEQEKGPWRGGMLADESELFVLGYGVDARTSEELMIFGVCPLRIVGM